MKGRVSWAIRLRSFPGIRETQRITKGIQLNGCASILKAKNHPLIFMKTILFVMATAIGLASHAQTPEHWTVELNSKALLTAKTEDTAANTVTVNDLKKGSLIVTYVPGVVEGQRKRRLMVYDAGDQELYSKESLSLVIPVKTLKKWRLTSPRITVYTVPVLGEEGATVRLRRVHLCTVQFN